MWGQFPRILFPVSTPFRSLSLEEGASQMLGICLKEKNQGQSSGTGKSSTAAHHRSEIFLKVTSVFLSWNTVVNFTHSCLVEASPHTMSLQHEL